MEINGFKVKKFNVHEFDLRNNSSGKFTTTCAFCSSERTTEAHKKQKCCAIDLDVGFYTCNHCGRSGQLHTFEVKKTKTKKKVYRKPDWKNYTKLSDKIVKWFEDERKISQKTLINAKVASVAKSMPPDWKKMLVMCFCYYRYDELIYIKYRSNEKTFNAFKDGELILYNYDSIIQSDECMIVEGEIDCLTWMEAGYPYVVSVPNGATLGKINLDYIDSAIDEGIFDNKKTIYIGGDNDEAGINLRNELVRRLGAERCYKVSYKESKDANEFFVKECKKSNKQEASKKLIEIKDSAELFPIKGIIGLEEVEDDLDSYFEHGLPTGFSLPFEDLKMNIETGRVMVVTGIPSHGKTEVVKQILAYFATVHQWKSGVFSPETFPPKLFYALMIQTLIGRQFQKGKMNQAQYAMGKEYLKHWIKFIYPEDFKLGTLLEVGKQLVYRFGIKIFVIDAYNNVQHDYSKFEQLDTYVEKFYIRLHEFAKRHDVLVLLVAHPTKIEKNKEGQFPVPTAYNIKGGSGHYEKADFILCPYRDFSDNTTSIYAQKVKFKHLGEVSVEDYKLNPVSSRFHLKRAGNPDMNNWIVNPPFRVNESDDQLLQDQEFNEDLANADIEEYPF